MEGISEEIEIHFRKLRAEQSKTEQEKRKTGHAAGKIGPYAVAEVFHGHRRRCNDISIFSNSLAINNPLVKPMDKRKNLKEKLLWKQGVDGISMELEKIKFIRECHVPSNI
ncbi:hypothetical protein HPP92_008443 [Vanilla planifolia]|uniref:Uncharacterized protein n=1 Tax=Vanilla planifolia TaxID=51239 RepID=A0A835R8V3_VANPL|nr:hypothetical protein HPP92_008443 [Vanilla planifolia]